jgi:hypothetical protein
MALLFPCLIEFNDLAGYQEDHGLGAGLPLSFLPLFFPLGG